MQYVSTRGDNTGKRSAQAIIQGLAGDKGLYVPDTLPKFDYHLDFSALKDAPYARVAYHVLSLFLDDFSEEDLHKCVLGAYDDKFDTPLIAPVVSTEKAHFLELYHGRTAAFKDMALSILPYLLLSAIRRENEDRKIVILTATSGDTGKAALEGFADVSGTEIIVFYPKDGVSEIQRQQMITQKGSNTHVFAIDGNFDDAQTGVKNIFNNDAFAAGLEEDGFRLSSANSINIGRLVPQVAYYVYAYLQLIKGGSIKLGDEMNVVVPTGNFGNILAAWYAKQIGIPIGKFICASNENKVLTDFINTGEYDANRQFYLTSSPSMDILISSNLERLLWHLSGGDSEEIASYMKELEEDRKYRVGSTIMGGLCDFYGGTADMEAAHKVISDLWNDEHYLIDTHTAVAYSVYLDYLRQTNDKTPAIIASTASAYKFADKVSVCLNLPVQKDGFAYIDALYEATKVPVPGGLRGLKNKAVTQTGEIAAAGMADAIKALL
jgi:threonine synthase